MVWTYADGRIRIASLGDAASPAIRRLLEGRGGAPLEACARAALRSGNAEISEIETEGPGGPRFQVRAIPIPPGAERAAAVLEIAEATAERDRAALESTEERYRTLVERNLDGVYLIQDGRFRYVNPALAEIFGYAGPEEIVGCRSVDDLTAPEDRDLVRENLRRRIEGEVGEIQYIFTGLRKDGARIRCEARGTAVPFGGRPAVIGTLRDVSERDRSARALAESEERYRRLFDSAGEGIFIIDLRGIYRDVNPAGCRMFGFAREELIGRHVSILLFPEDRERYLRGCEARWRLDRQIPAVRMRRKDGSEIWVEMTSRPFEVGGETLVMGIKRELTRILGAEEIQKGFAAMIERTKRLEALGRLAGGVAHDFNNLLTSIAAAASLLRRKLPAAGDGKEEIDAILEAAEHAGALTRQLLAFSREQTLARRVFDLNAAIRDIESLLKHLLPPRIEMEIRTDADPCPIEADPVQISQVIINLVLNARDAIEGAGEIAISTRPIFFDAVQPGDVGPGSYIRLCVSDTGRGIPPQDRERIFEPFFTTKWRGEGTGLGLSTVYGIVLQHAGRIEFDSEPSRGTTFIVDLPRAEKPLDPPVEAVGDLPGAPPGGKTILLVEEENTIRETIAAGLGALGYEVLPAASVEDALGIARTRAGPIHLLLAGPLARSCQGAAIAEAIERERPGIPVLPIAGSAAGDRRAEGEGEPTLPLSDLARRIREILAG